MPLNKNNFLRWTGSFSPLYYNIGVTTVASVTLFANRDETRCSPLILAFASNGVDYTSLEIVSIKDSSGNDIILYSPLRWDSSSMMNTSALTVTRPIDISLTVYYITFKFSDVLGNESSNFTQTVNVSTIYTTWIPYPSTVVCNLDSFGNNTGYKSWTQLQLVNSSTGSPISPLELKNNEQGDIDYYSPVQDFVTCTPSGAGSGLYASLLIANNSQNALDTTNFITIINIFLSSTTLGPGGTPFSQNVPCSIPPGENFRVVVPQSSLGFTYDGGISVFYTVSGNMSTAPIPRYWKKNNGGVVVGFGPGGTGLTSNLVDNSGVITSGGSIDVTNVGLTIFAQ